MSDELCNSEYRCPGEAYAIPRAVHLARLGGYYPACRDCPKRSDTAGLSARQVRRLADMPRRSDDRFDVGPEGIRGAAINDFSTALARTIVILFARGVANRRAVKGTVPILATTTGHPSGMVGAVAKMGLSPSSRATIAFASDGRLATAAIIAAVVEGIRWAGCEVLDLGAASAPCMARALDHFAADGGIYLGNPIGAKHTLGMRFWTCGEPALPRETLDAIVGAVLHKDGVGGRPERNTALDRPTRAFGPLRSVDATEIYLGDFRPAYHALRPLRFVLQCACEPVLSYLDELLQNVACRVIRAEPGKGAFGRQIVAAQAHFGMQITDDGENGRVYDEKGFDVAMDRLSAVMREEVEFAERDSAKTACLADALRTLTRLLVFLSRDDVPLSVALDRIVDAQ